MKLNVIVNEQGDIVGTSHILAAHQRSKDAPTHGGLIPRPGQRIYEIDAPADLLQIKSAAELHQRYRLEVKGTEARLVEVQKAKY